MIHKYLTAVSAVLRADALGNRAMPGAHIFSMLVVALCFGFSFAQNIAKGGAESAEAAGLVESQLQEPNTHE